MSDPSQQRRTVYYSGRVQGVGFRYTATAIAQGYEVTGFVQNLPDGRVLLVAEGAKADLDAFLPDVADRMSAYIRGTSVDVSPATGEFRGFGPRH